MDLNLVLALFAGVIVLLSAFSSALQRASLPEPLLTLAFGVLIGPYALGLISMEDFGIEQGRLLEEVSRLTLAVGLAGVALRLPHGYWRANTRWVVVMISLGMTLMFLLAAGILWGLLGLPFLVALLLGAIITPTDPIVSSPIVTGSLAKRNIPERVRFDISSETGINDGLGYLFVMLPVLLLTSPDTAWPELLTSILLREVLGAVAFGGAAGWALARVFVIARRHDLMEEDSYLGFIIPASLLVLGAAKLPETDGVLAVFVAAAFFGQLIPPRDEAQEGKIDDAVNRFFTLPVFTLLGVALPIAAWGRLGAGAIAAVVIAVLVRRIAAVWALRPLLRTVHSRAETAFISWFGPVGISALLYATLAERLTGNHEVFVLASLAITASVLIHGASAAPLGSWLRRQERQGRTVPT